jgi:hypothetical protein
VIQGTLILVATVLGFGSNVKTYVRRVIAMRKFIIMVCVIAAIFFVPRVGRFITGTSAPSPTGPTGEWVGVGKVREVYSQGLWGDTPGPHHDVAIKFTLKQYDGFMDRYTGSGELTIFGEGKPRVIQVDDVRNRPTGVITIRMTTSPKMLEKFDARLAGDQMTWADNDGLVASATLHRGTDADYQALVKQQH